MLTNSSGILLHSRTQIVRNAFVFFIFYFWRRQFSNRIDEKYQFHHTRWPHGICGIASGKRMNLVAIALESWGDEIFFEQECEKFAVWLYFEMSWNCLFRNSLFDQDLLICNSTWPASVSNQVTAWLFSKKLERKNSETINSILFVHHGWISRNHKNRKEKKGKNKRAQIM